MYEAIERFLAADIFAVAGASANPAKYGNQVYWKLVQSGRRTYPLNASKTPLLHVPAFGSLEELPELPHSLSIVTPPAVTWSIMQDAIRLGVRHIWTQPGAEHMLASQMARQQGIDVIDGGSCILVFLARE